MALVIKQPDEATLNSLLKLLVKERVDGYAKKTKTVYCITKDEEGNIRLPVALCMMMWKIQLPDYTQLPRYTIQNTIVLGEGGRDHQIPTYARLTEAIVKDHCAYLYYF